MYNSTIITGMEVQIRYIRYKIIIKGSQIENDFNICRYYTDTINKSMEYL